MANAARVHAVENGKDISDNLMIAFGGAAPLHAARLCEKLGVDLCLIPHGAGVGSAIGFLKAPFAYEAVASQSHAACATFDAGAVATLSPICSARRRLSCARAPTDRCTTTITAFMRYAGQGWEIPVPLLGLARV